LFIADHTDDIRTLQGLAFHRSSDWGLAYVGAFIFLRFFCPAIVSPKPHGIVKRTLELVYNHHPWRERLNC
jgi:hypothetical protein